VTISAGNNLEICVLGDLPAAGMTSGATASLRSHEGAIVDANRSVPTLSRSPWRSRRRPASASGDPLEIAVVNLEAQTETGGIFVANAGDLTVGNVSPGRLRRRVAGLRVTSGGVIAVDAAGSLSILVSGDAVVGPDEIFLTAGEDILTGGGQVAVASSGGNIVLTRGAICCWAMRPAWHAATLRVAARWC